MSKFDRIIHEALVMGGQARIRDTGITVNEVVQMSLDGQSQADILAKFTDLEVEDVHQAMGYSITDTVTIMKYAANDGATSLSVIKGFSELMLGKVKFSIMCKAKTELSQEQKQKYIEIIHTNALKAQFEWQKLYDRMLLNFDIKTLESFHIFEILETLPQNDLQYPVEIDWQNLQETKVYGVHQLRNLAKFLLEDYRKIESITVKIIPEDKFLSFRICIVGELIANLDLLTQSYFPIGMVAQALYVSGSELEVEQDEDKTIFGFTLSIADDEVEHDL